MISDHDDDVNPSWKEWKAKDARDQGCDSNQVEGAMISVI